jgi:hypothetical protein
MMSIDDKEVEFKYSISLVPTKKMPACIHVQYYWIPKIHSLDLLLQRYSIDELCELEVLRGQPLCIMCP